MSAETVVQQSHILRRRVADLYQQASQNPGNDLLSRAFDELNTVLEQLQAVEDTLRNQQQETAMALAACEQERLLTTDVFNGVPAPYFITGSDGTIRRLNRAAVLFFNQTEKFLLGKSLSLFIPEGERRTFRADLERLRGLGHHEEYTLRLQPHGDHPLRATLTVGPARDRSGRVSALHWLIGHTITRGPKDEARLRQRFA